MVAELPGWREITPAGVAFKSSLEYKTGEWGVLKPVIDQSKCRRCYLCVVYCPEGAPKVVEDGSVEVDLDYCKGCGICAEECPADAIEMKEVEEVGG